MNVKMRQTIERRIVRKFVKLALDAGFGISLNNGGDEYEFENLTHFGQIIRAMFATDEERLFLTKRREDDPTQWEKYWFGWIYFVYGNDGWDVICDHTTNLEFLMPEVTKLVDQLCEQYC